MERRDWGVPGYYYPVLLPDPDPRSQALLNEGMVTVIRIPFAEKNGAEPQTLFTEIERIHFNFVSLRIRKQHIHIQFQHDRIPACNFTKQISPKILRQHVQVCTLDQKIAGLAQHAGLSIEQPQVALSLENTEALTNLFRNVRQAIPLHFDHVNLLKINLFYFYSRHDSVLKSARNGLAKASGIFSFRKDHNRKLFK